MTYNCVLYARISTARQAPGGSITDQLERARSLAKSLDLEVVAEFVDEGISGTLFDEREGLQRLIHSLKSGNIKALLYYDSDRAARDWTVYARMVSIIERENSVQMIDFSQPRFIQPDLFNPYSTERILYHSLKGLMSEVAFRQIVERMHSGRLRAHNTGKYMASDAPYGYKSAFDDQGKRVIIKNPLEAGAIEQIPDLLRKGLSTVKIKRWLIASPYPPRKGGNWTTTVIGRIMRNPFYAGKVKWGKTLAPHACHPDCWHPWSWETYTEMLEILNSRKQFPPKSIDNRSPLSGLIRCGLCGHSMYSNIHIVPVSRERYFYYTCSQKSQANCKAGLIPVREIVPVVIGEMLRVADLYQTDYPEFVRQYHTAEPNTAPLEGQLKEYQTEITRLEKQIETAQDKLVEGVLTDKEYLATKNRINTRLDALRSSQSRATEELTLLQGAKNRVKDLGRVFTDFSALQGDFSQPYELWSDETMHTFQRLAKQTFRKIYANRVKKELTVKYEYQI